MPDHEPFDPPAVHCRHLLVCRRYWYDPELGSEGHTAIEFVVNLANPAGTNSPFRVPRLFLVAQLFGTPGDYDAWVVLVRDPDEESAEQVVEWGPLPASISGHGLVESHSWPLVKVPFPGPGLYEFQLRVSGSDEPLAGERVWVPEHPEESP